MQALVTMIKWLLLQSWDKGTLFLTILLYLGEVGKVWPGGQPEE